MSDVRPFRALRYNTERIEDWGAVLAPPYDIIGDRERAALLARSPYQITQIEAPLDAAGVTKAAALLPQWRREGVLQRDEAPAYYVAEQHFRHAGAERSRLNLYAVLRLAPWEAGAVRPHEWTMAAPKAQRRLLREAARADISPLMVLVPDRRGRIREQCERARGRAPVSEGVDANGERHTLRIIDEPAAVAALRDAFAEETLYIADGHHRYESALEDRDRRAAAAGAAWTGEEPENFVLTGLVPADDPGLVVGATHRLIHLPPPVDALARLATLFRVEEAGGRGAGPDALLRRLAQADGANAAIGVVGLNGDANHLLIADERTRAAYPPHLPPSWATLGAALLQSLVLEPLFGIDDRALRRGAAVTYTHEAGDAYQAVRDGRAALAFLLAPPRLEQIFAAADSGDRMPQKSTYFLPKLPTGAVLHAFD